MLKKGKWGSYYSNTGIKIATKSEVELFKKLIPTVRKEVKKLPADYKIKPTIDRLNNFKSRQAFTHYLNLMKRISKGNYARTITINFRKNLVKAINNSEKSRFSKSEMDIITKKIKGMSLKEFTKYSKRFNWRSIGYIYYEIEPTQQEFLAMYGL